MELTPDLLLAMMPHAGGRAQVYAEPLERAMRGAYIDNLRRRASFLAQLAHESGSLRYVEEIADGSAYEGRADLGNTQPGDGVRFKGRALIQVTGRANYAACGKALKLDLLASPELLCTPENAARASAWFWSMKGLSVLADDEKFGTVTRLINGGYRGLDDRIAHWLRIRRVLGL
jgi:putative chitinase